MGKEWTLLFDYAATWIKQKLNLARLQYELKVTPSKVTYGFGQCDR